MSAPKNHTRVRILKPELFKALEGRTARFVSRRPKGFDGGWVDQLYLDEPYVVSNDRRLERREIRMVYVGPEDYEVLGDGE